MKKSQLRINPKAFYHIIVWTLCGFLMGCGQAGPLYLPPPTKLQPATTPSTTTNTQSQPMNQILRHTQVANYPSP